MMQAILDSPLLGLGLSAATFALGRWIQKKTGWTIANPLLISAVLCIALLLVLEIPYEAYAQGGEFINLMLSPVTAILALGIYNQRAVLKRYFVPVLVGCLVGSASSVLSVLGLCRLFGLDQTITAALIPITAACVIFTGLVGALGAPFFAKVFRITDPVAQGLAVGACSHALGTSKAREMGELQSAMSSIAIGVCGLLTVLLSLVLPL